MKTQTARNTALALLGLLALTIYILACTSFSPDDSRILYPAFDPASGAIGMSVYDRAARRSQMVFLPIAYEGAQTNVPAVQFIRGQWLPDGRNIVLAWAGGNGTDEGVNLALAPAGARAPFKVFRVPTIKEAETLLMVPPCLVGEQLFIKSDSKEVLRVDLNTGSLARHEFQDIKDELSLFPDPAGTGVFYVESQEKEGKRAVFGRMNPVDFSRAPLMVITNDMEDGTFFAYDKEGKSVAFIAKANDASQLVVLRQGKPAFARSLGGKADLLAFGNAGFSPKGDMVWATFQKKADGKDLVSYGLMEIPLNDAPTHETMLIAAAPSEKDAVMYFQGSLSHDGKAAAVASTYLGLTEGFKPEDCALFLVDLSDPNRKVTKVPIPLPANRPREK